MSRTDKPVVVVTAKTYPNLYKAFREIDLDNNIAVRSVIPIKRCAAARLRNADKLLAKLTHKHFKILCVGEYTEQQELIKDFKLQSVDKILNDYFEDIL